MRGIEINPFHAVLTGDIVNSTLLSAESEQILLRALAQVLAPYKTEYYRGDSFQVYIPSPGDALQTAIHCRMLAIALTAEEDEPVLSDIRIAIGIGSVNGKIRALGTAKGDAFLRSG